MKPLTVSRRKFCKLSMCLELLECTPRLCDLPAQQVNRLGHVLRAPAMHATVMRPCSAASKPFGSGAKSRSEEVFVLVGHDVLRAEMQWHHL